VTGRGLKGLDNFITARGRIIVWQIWQADLPYRKLFNLLAASLTPSPEAFSDVAVIVTRYEGWRFEI